ncbi:hypothetical protein ACH474_14860 [Nocardia rhamnosiphila]|uniref:Uncharacterized protein n=1 Tax=Nocardia rhamnosiphila TaxID=426716 RepID=A0ABV2WXE1_9NOCA|nr:hypothetical protein [Nocardia rhamnosiphila]
MSLVACVLIAGFVFGLLLLRAVAVFLEARDEQRVRVPVRSRRRPHRR